MTFDPRTRRKGNAAIATGLIVFTSGVYYYAVTQGTRKLENDLMNAIEKRRNEQVELEERKKKSRTSWLSRKRSGDDGDRGSSAKRWFQFWR
jgi:hypothetical protein